MGKLIHRTTALTSALVTPATDSVCTDAIQRGASAVATAAVTESDVSGGATVDQNLTGTTEVAASQSSTAAVQATTAVAPYGSGVNSGAAKVVTNTLFDGDELMLVTPCSVSQMMDFVVITKASKVLAFDGGTEYDTEHLEEVLRTRGGHVTAQFITHPHSDYVGTLTKILQNPSSGIKADAVCYNFQPQK